MASSTRTAAEQYSEIKYEASALLLMPMKRTDSPGVCSPGRPGWKRPMTPCFFSPTRNKRMLLLPLADFDFVLPSTSNLSQGMIGTPRHVMNGDPNSVTVAGGTPRRVHSRPNAAIARGCARKNDGSFQTLVRSSSRSSGVGAPLRVATRWLDGT